MAAVENRIHGMIRLEHVTKTEENIVPLLRIMTVSGWSVLSKLILMLWTSWSLLVLLRFKPKFHSTSCTTKMVCTDPSRPFCHCLRAGYYCILYTVQCTTLNNYSCTNHVF